MTKASRQKLKYLENEVLRWNKKHFSTFYKGFSAAKNCLKPESASLTAVLQKDLKDRMEQVQDFFQKHKGFNESLYHGDSITWKFMV